MDTPVLTDWLTADDITPALRLLFGESVTVDGGWSSEPLFGGARETLGIWRIAGSAATGHGDRTWSMVLKGYPHEEISGSPSAWDWPWREAELYRSGLLDDLPGISAPSCYGTIERDGAVWLWLDDLSALPQPEWTLKRYATLARHVGNMNGAWLAGRPLPDHPSLSRRWLEGWLAANDDVMGDFAARRHRLWEIAPDAAPVFLRLWEERHRMLEFLASMPQTFCHLDAHAKNAFFRPRDGEEEIVLIDWSFAGLAAPGEELAALVATSAIFIPAAFAMKNAIEASAFPAYLEGLREAGWDGHDGDVWRAYRYSLLLRYGPGQVRLVPDTDPGEELRAVLEATFGMPLESLTSHMANFPKWIADLATGGY